MMQNLLSGSPTLIQGVFWFNPERLNTKEYILLEKGKHHLSSEIECTIGTAELLSAVLGTTVGGLEIGRLKSINISGPRCDSALIFFL